MNVTCRCILYRLQHQETISNQQLREFEQYCRTLPPGKEKTELENSIRKFRLDNMQNKPHEF